MFGWMVEFFNCLMEELKSRKEISTLLHIGRRMKHHDATDFDMSIFELAADLLLDELVIGLVLSY